MMIEVGKYYKTRDGQKAYVAYEHPKEFRGIDKDAFYVFKGYINYSAHDDMCNWSVDGFFYEASLDDSSSDLVAPWEDVEEIDVSETWVIIGRQFKGSDDLISKMLCSYNKPPVKDNTVAIVTVKDWIEIQQGKRKLVIGEGL